MQRLLRRVYVGEQCQWMEQSSKALLHCPCVVVPGSFHPFHEGHFRIAVEASALSGLREVVFELSQSNVDKPPLSSEMVEQRLTSIFTGVSSFLQSAPSTVHSLCFSVAITSLPRLVDKLAVFPTGSVLAIGIDTAIRLLNPLYCNQSAGETVESVLEGLASHLRWIFVAGRSSAFFPALVIPPGLLQRRPVHDTNEPLQLGDILQLIPLSVRQLFVPLNNVRVDISSRQIRERLLQETQAASTGDSNTGRELS